MDLLPSTCIVLSYNIFPPLPQHSTMEKALWMAQGHRSRSLPGVSDSHLALQIITQHYSKNKLESPNCTSLLYEGQDEEIWGGWQKKIHLLTDIINVIICHRAHHIKCVWHRSP